MSCKIPDRSSYLPCLVERVSKKPLPSEEAVAVRWSRKRYKGSNPQAYTFPIKGDV